MEKMTIKDIEVTNKRVLVRADDDVDVTLIKEQI
jgi:3-phosphoglycerate kinase